MTIKHFKNEDYEIFFDPISGLEMLRGVNGKPDPFSLVLPSLLDIGIMGTCSNKCMFCYQGHTNKPNMKLDDFKLIIDEVKYHTNQVALGGRGDPNKHENFKEIIECCRLNEVVPNYTTSGINLTDEEIEISKLCGAVAVSEYEQNHTYNAIDRFINAGIKTNIHLIFSYVSFDKIVRILSGNNIWKKGDEPSKVNIDKLNAVIFLLFKPQGAGKSLSMFKPIPKQINKISEIIFEPQCKFKVGMDSCLANHIIPMVKPNPIIAATIDSCEGARMSGYISSDMKFMPCSFSDKEHWSVNITAKNYIPKIWQKSRKFKAFRKMLKRSPCSCPLGL